MRWLLALLLLFPIEAQAQRIIPTSNVVVYVAPNGSDLTGDGSQGHPWATPQKAVDELSAHYDFQCKFAPTIQLKSAPQGEQYLYPGVQISGRLTGQCGTLRPLVVGNGEPDFPIGKYLPFTLRGDPSYPLGAFLNPNPPSGRPAIPGLSLTDGAALKVEGISFDTSNAKQDNIDVFTGSFLDLSNVVFGNAGALTGGPNNGPTGNIHIGVAWSSTLVITGPIWIHGSAGSWIQTGANSQVYCDNNGYQGQQIPVTQVYPGTYYGGFIANDGGSTMYMGCAMSGQVHGPKAVITRNSVLDTFSGNGVVPCNQNLVPGDQPMVIQDYSVCR